MIISARLANAYDQTDIESIAAVIADEIRDHRGGAVHLAEQSLVPPAHVVFVGCIDDVVVGFARVHVQRLDIQNTVGEVTAYGVLEGARGVGVGEAMLDLVIAFCAEQRCTGIDAHALPGARETKNFFETFGFTARRLVVHHSLNGE